MRQPIPLVPGEGPGAARGNFGFLDEVAFGIVGVVVRAVGKQAVAGAGLVAGACAIAGRVVSEVFVYRAACPGKLTGGVVAVLDRSFRSGVASKLEALLDVYGLQLSRHKRTAYLIATGIS